ncbi:hypothetical protein TCAL_12217, partial [Tigriopus californicus]
TFIALIALVAVAFADNAPYRPAPSYKEQPAAYQYQYAVADDYAGVNFAQNEARDGYATNGEYRVALPDGRTQIVTYNVADAYSGYVADTFITLLALVAIALADNAPYRPAPYSPAPTYKEEPAAYQYQYAVADDYAGVNFAQNEARDGYATNGEYRVALPDGRTQIVTYNVADAYSGYVADIDLFHQPFNTNKMQVCSKVEKDNHSSQTFIAFLALAAVALADNAPYKPAPSYKEQPAAYQYQYAVADDYAGVNFAQNEARDGYATNGEYRVALPDGRTQIVTYNVGDAYSGYVADVRYEGEPKTFIAFQTFIAFLALAAVVLADNAPYKPAPSYKEQPAAYQYQYAVADDYAGVNFGQNEARDGYATNGEYRVALPDGRTQIVTYNVADAYSGYVADVRYERET